MTQTPRKPQPPHGASQPRMTRRAASRHERELNRQRLIMIISGSAIGLALLAVLAGVIYDQVWLPSRPIAEINGTTLSRNDYTRERRNEIARNVAQSLFLSTFGAQFADRFLGQIGTLDSEVAQLRNEPVNESTVNTWVENQLIQQGARQLNMQATDDEIAQQFAVDFGPSFIAPLTPTIDLTPTTAPPTEVPLTPTSAATPEATPGGPTATLPPTVLPTATSTPLPTNTPTATPLPDAARSQQDQIYAKIFDQYTQEILRVDPNRKPQLTLDDFKTGLRDQYISRVLTLKIEEQLVPDASFTPSTDPSSLETRHILIAVTVSLTETETQREAAYAARRADAEAILAQLRGGANFETLAKEKSEDLTTRDSGGNLPPFDKDGKTQQGTQIDPAFAQATLALKEGEISNLVRTPFGWHIIQLNRRVVDSREDQLRAKRTEALGKWLEQQRASAAIQRFPAVTATPTPPPTGTPGPLPTAPMGGEPTPLPIIPALTPTIAPAP